MMRMVSAGAAQGLVGSVARRDGIEVEGSFGAVGAMIEKFRAGEPCDVVILTRRQVEELEREGGVVAGTAMDLGAAPTSIAVRSGDAAPDVATADALRKALVAADAIYFPDPAKATAGIHFASVLEKLGITAQTSSRWKTYPNGATAMREMAKASGSPIGCTQATEILATPGVTLVAPLPAGYSLATVYTAAVSTRAADAPAATRFVQALGGVASAGLRREAGFEE